MLCCSNCFADKFLKDYITSKSLQVGECPICGQHSVPLIDAGQITDLFQPILDLYDMSPNEGGQDLDVLMQSDWLIFAEFTKRIDRQQLLIAICADRYSGSSKYQAKIEHEQDKIEQWNRFREELKHKNRYFPQNVPDIDHLKNLFEFLRLPDADTPRDFYRARINTEACFGITDIMKPPDKDVTNGRANPKGISYFYAASDQKTAIHEVRPSKGDKVTVAHFQSPSSLPMADLRNPKHTISPFELDDDDLINLYKEMPYLTTLGEELSKPILPREADLEYLASQYLCEFTKHIGFSGVIYRSSLTDGDNYALFNDDTLVFVKMEEFRITGSRIEYEPLSAS